MEVIKSIRTSFATHLASVSGLVSNANNQTVSTFQRITSAVGSFAGPTEDFDAFVESLKSIDDKVGDIVTDTAVGAYDDGIEGTGAVYNLFLNTDGIVEYH